MTTITIPPDLESRLAEEASRRGTTPEQLAVEGLRRLFTPPPEQSAPDASLFDYLAGHIGAIAGSAEALSEDCGRRFAEHLAAENQRVQP